VAVGRKLDAEGDRAVTRERTATLASFARTALTDPDALPTAEFERLQSPAPDVRATFDPGTPLAVIYAVGCLDAMLLTFEP
jgi:hypothetical protein